MGCVSACPAARERNRDRTGAGAEIVHLATTPALTAVTKPGGQFSGRCVDAKRSAQTRPESDAPSRIAIGYLSDTEQPAYR
jgi:hypothetical protein